jgi:hypothetical protein
MATRKYKRYDGEDGSMVGIPDQTADEASNEAALNADLPRRRAMDEGSTTDGPDQAASATPASQPKARPTQPSSRGTSAAATPTRSSSTDDRSKRPSMAGNTRTNENYGNEGRGSKAPVPSIRPSQADMERAIDIGTGGGAEGVGIKGVAALAKAAANRGGASGLRTITQGALEGPAATRALTNAPTRQIGLDKAGMLAKQRAARAEGRNAEMLSENARRSGVTPGSAGAEAIRNNLGGKDWTLGMKRGGKVKGYASGGSVSSASSRGDGIASRGKTRGTMVMCGGGMAKGGKAR